MINLSAGWPLPIDLDLIIIHYLLDDKPTLASCSLVCSRWLPPSRKHLFKDIAIKGANHPTPGSLADFFRIVEHSGAVNPEWAIGPCLKKFKLDGRVTDQESSLRSPTVTCTLSVLRALLSALPNLASLYVMKSLILDDTPQEPTAGQCHLSPFELDELTICQCTAPTEDPYPLFALICMFSSIGSLSVDRWGKWRPNPLPAFSLAPLSPPVVRSLVIGLVRDPVAARALYALLASSPSVADACLTRISAYACDYDDVVLFTGLVNLTGPALRDVELRVEEADICPDRKSSLSSAFAHPGFRTQLACLTVLGGILLTTCATLSSLTLSFECSFDDSSMQDAEDTRNMLGLYTTILRTHRNIFVELTAVRLEMRPTGQDMFDAFVRVVRDTYRVGREEMVHIVPPPEADQNRVAWEFLEDALCDFPALKHLELVLYETSRPGGTLPEAGKADLRSALAGRLPRLWPSETAQLVFETLVDDA